MYYGSRLRSFLIANVILYESNLDLCSSHHVQFFVGDNVILYEMSSLNEQDFYNLVDVYLDAVFYPRCVNDINTFQQEGWHYELNDPSEDITFKGKMDQHLFLLHKGLIGVMKSCS